MVRYCTIATTTIAAAVVVVRGTNMNTLTVIGIETSSFTNSIG